MIVVTQISELERFEAASTRTADGRNQAADDGLFPLPVRNAPAIPTGMVSVDSLGLVEGEDYLAGSVPGRALPAGHAPSWRSDDDLER
jgi:hypothetical protein